MSKSTLRSYAIANGLRRTSVPLLAALLSILAIPLTIAYSAWWLILLVIALPIPALGVHDALQSPALLDVKVNRMELVMPPEVEASQVVSTAIFGIKAILSGRADEFTTLLKNNFWR